MSPAEREALAGLVEPCELADGALFEGPGTEPAGVFFLKSGRVSVSARLPNGLYAEPIAVGVGVTLGESCWPRVRTPRQRIWANSGATGWILPATKLANVERVVPKLGDALETLGTMRRGLAGVVAASKTLPGLAGAPVPVLAGIVMTGEVTKFAKGDKVLTAERPDAPSPTIGMYLLVSGEIRAVSPDGLRVTVVTAGTPFGGLARGGMQCEPEDAVATVDSVVIRIPLAVLQMALLASPTLRAAAVKSPVYGEQVRAIVEVLLVVGDPEFPMRAITDLVAQTAVADFDDRMAVLRLLPRGQPAEAMVQGPDKVWRGAVPFDPDAPGETTIGFGLNTPGNLEYLLLDTSAVPREHLITLRRSVTRALVVSSKPWQSPPFPLGPGRVNWCLQLGGGYLPSEPPYPPSTVRVRFDLARVARARTLSDLSDADRERFSRWIRDITERRVGIALGGGGSWGFAHTTLIKAIRQAKIPIDMVSGSSFGSLCGAFWCATQDKEFVALKEFAPRAQLTTRTAFFSSVFLQQGVDRALKRATRSQEFLRLEELEVPLYPVATNISAGCEAVIGVGSVGFGVRCSSSFPGIITPTTGSGFRYVDGGIVRNVPTTPLANQGANLLIASNIVANPAYEASTSPMISGRAGRFLYEFNLWQRANDTMRSALILMHAAGEATANANHVAAALDIDDTCDCFDVNNTCTGFLTGLDIAARSVATGMGPVAVIAVETFSRNLSPKEPRAMMVFADGAAACIIGPARTAEEGLLAVHLRNNAMLRGRILHAHPQPGMYYQFAPSGKELADAAIACIGHASRTVMQSAGLGPDEVDRFLPHQPNGPLYTAIARDLGFGPEKLYPVVDDVGSLGAASAPYSLDQATRTGSVRPGMTLLLAGVGSGTSYGAILLRTAALEPGGARN